MELRKPFSYQTKREFRQFIVKNKANLSYVLYIIIGLNRAEFKSTATLVS